MDKRRDGKPPAVRLEYTFDRLLKPKLEQVYGILAPAKLRILGEERELRDDSHEERRNLRARVLR
jgi:hypothetical protein